MFVINYKETNNNYSRAKYRFVVFVDNASLKKQKLPIADKPRATSFVECALAFEKICCGVCREAITVLQTTCLVDMRFCKSTREKMFIFNLYTIVLFALMKSLKLGMITTNIIV